VSAQELSFKKRVAQHRVHDARRAANQSAHFAQKTPVSSIGRFGLQSNAPLCLNRSEIKLSNPPGSHISQAHGDIRLQ
jgi:hypothetical protein